jgi:hypothetical protein
MLVVIMILSSCWYPKIVSPFPSLAYQLFIWNYFKCVTTCLFTRLLLGPCFLFSHPLTFYYPSILTPLSPNEWTCIPTWKLWWNLCCIVEIPLANQAKIQFAHCCPSSSLWATFLAHVIDIKAQVVFFFYISFLWFCLIVSTSSFSIAFCYMMLNINMKLPHGFLNTWLMDPYHLSFLQVYMARIPYY